MTALTTGLEPVRATLSGRAADRAETPARTPMSQQSTVGCNGYNIHPQEFVRLSGCQERALRREKKRALVLS